MPKLTLTNLGALVAEKRGDAGLRAAAADIGISAATLSRVENGNLPDLETFRKICLWLRVDPGELLGGGSRHTGAARVHLRAPSAMPVETAQSLARMIIAAQNAVARKRR